MNIAFLSKYLPSDQPNGVSVQVHRLASALVHRGHRVTCFSFSPPVENASYLHVKLSWKTGSRFLRKFLPAVEFRAIKTGDFDIVHYHGDDYLCRGSGRRIRTFYGSALQEAIHAASPGRFLYQALFYSFEWISCFKRGTLAAISRNTLCSLPRVKKYVPCGVPLDLFLPQIDKKTDHPSILFIGDFNSRKRGSLLIDVFHNLVLPENPSCTLTVVGPQKCSGKNVIYVGQPGEAGLIDLFQKSWIYCMPSSYEGFGVPALEAMACGTPVIATKNAGSNEIFKSGCNIILCTPDSLGQKINNLLANLEILKKTGEKGLDLVQFYDIMKIAEEYERLYKSAIQKNEQK